jgi:hypothetical protein
MARLNNSLIQATNYNLHLDALVNATGDGASIVYGVMLNGYAPNCNSYLNPASGVGSVMVGTYTYNQ